MANMDSQSTNYDIILASASPRRKDLMEEAGYDFTVCVSPIDEPNHIARDMSPAAHAEALAMFKASAVKDLHPNSIIIGADTIVAVGPEIIGKADDEAHARAILNKLCRNKHEVITAIAIIYPDKPRVLISAVTWIKMHVLSERELDDYIASGEWQGKAGAYGIQGEADKFVESIEGSYTNVVGMPMELLKKLLPPK